MLANKEETDPGGFPMSDKPEYVYVASSWRNPIQTAVCTTLRASGIPHYDFKNPSEGETGFHWSDIMADYHSDTHLCHVVDYWTGLHHPVAERGYRRDYEAMVKADTFVLILPCGRSAHLELGWAVGQGKRTAILLDGPLVTPELMYKMVDYLAPSLFDLLGWLGVED